MKTLRYISLAAVLALGLATMAQAAITGTFNVTLTTGSTNTAEVVKLQQFLIDFGYLKIPAPTGAFLSMTKAAVAAFQTAEGISPAVGYFGPVTQAAANAKLASGTKTSTPATIHSQSVTTGGSQGGAAILSNQKTITWQASGYPAGVGVNINLLRKTSATINAFSFIRTIAKDTTNDGSESWTPLAGENTGDVYVEVTCSSTYQFKAGCNISGTPIKVN